ncbi:DUF3916 domain-containing protein [Undibacterium flavidum]|uniref:DUF3916 domain-containing protein n=1 Tax=Undibacterium flavidum TaxID=2762297 RepID=A0ABR6YDY4_9BURK|nr:DUF3916 domain-containing protein [Undibacterium flavidum]MBC3874743.1 DUF3916 domain-containing protein [Undibacterium flavidum]
MRQLSFNNNKKVRGIHRRLRSLRKWASDFSGLFPADLTIADRYYNYKIPVLRNFVEGKQATRAVQVECAQLLINACTKLMQSKPENAKSFRVVATICIPDMFTSEVCIYTDEEYFQIKIQPRTNNDGKTVLLHGRSLANEWGLVLPDGVKELGVSLTYQGYDDPDDWYVSEHWQFGEVL